VIEITSLSLGNRLQWYWQPKAIKQNTIHTP